MHTTTIPSVLSSPLQDKVADASTQQPQAMGSARPQGQLEFKYPQTDTGNAELLVHEHGREIRYLSDAGKAGRFLVFDGCRWKVDSEQHVQNLAKLTIRGLKRKAREARLKLEAEIDRATEAGTITPERRKLLLEEVACYARLENHAARSESRSKREAMVKLAQSEPRLRVSAPELDSDAYLLNVVNGTINLRTGQLENHRPTDYITKLAPVVYDAQAVCPLWMAHLDKVQPDPEIRGFIQRLVGMALIGEVKDNVLPIHYGLGRNGKGVTTDTLLHLLGDYGKQILVEILIEKNKFDRHPTERASLQGCRLAATSEPPKGARFDEAQVKLLTGGDMISARRMRQDFSEFVPSHTFWLSTNHKPVIKDHSEAMRRRMLLIPWTVTISEAECDPDLKNKLKQETAGILRWAIEGCLAYQQHGLDAPKAVRVASAEWLDEQNNVRAFVQENCTTGPQDKVRVSTTGLYEAYQEWCSKNGELALGMTDFRDSLMEMGFEKGKSSGLKVYKGLNLKPPVPSAQAQVKAR
jgi:putative DNA primase/helicase